MSALTCADKKMRDAQEELWAIFARQRAGEKVDAELEEAAATVDYWSIEIEVLTAHEKYVIAQTEWTEASDEAKALVWDRSWEAQAAKDGETWKGAASRAALMHDRSVRALRMKADTLLGKMIDAEIQLDQIRKAASRRTALVEDKAVAEYMAQAKACWPEDKPWDEETMRQTAIESIAAWKSQQPEIDERIMRQIEEEAEARRELEEEARIEEEAEEEEDDGRELCSCCNKWADSLIRTSDDDEVCSSCANDFYAQKKQGGLGVVSDIRASLLEHAAAVQKKQCECYWAGGDEDVELCSDCSLKEEAAGHRLKIHRWFDENGDEI